MLVRHLGTNTKQGGSPKLYISDDARLYIVQGWRTDEPGRIEIPHALLGFLEPDTCLGAQLHDTGHGTFLLSGEPLTDREALEQMQIPDHETAIVVAIFEEGGPMLYLHDDEFNQLFRDVRERAFHLETQDAYNTPEEAEPLRRWLAGEPDGGAEWYSEWDDLMTQTTQRGVAVQRVRIVTVPNSDYTRWLCATSDSNIAAGEDIRWLPRHLVSTDEYTVDDWWLWDDDILGFTVFEPSGRFAGAAVTTDTVLVERCRTVRDRLWPKAIPHAEYIRSGYVAQR